jgi:MFS family permease
MTEPVEDVQEDNNRPTKSTPHSRKSSTPVVHDATLTRRPRLPDLHVEEEEAEAESSLRIADRFPSALISRMRPTTSATTDQNTYTANLRESQEKYRTASNHISARAQVQANASTIFSKTIHDLESLLNEALQIAQVAADDNEGRAHESSPKLVDVPAHGQNPNPAVLVEDLKSAAYGSRVLQSNEVPVTSNGPLPGPSDQNNFQKEDYIKACGPAHQGGIEAKSSAAKPQVSYVLQHDWAQPFYPPKPLQQNLSFGGYKQLRLPDRASAGLREPLDHILRRKASKQDLPSRDDARTYGSSYIAPPNLPRSTSNHSKRAHLIREDPRTEPESVNAVNIKNATSPPKDTTPASDKNTIDRFQEMFGVESSHGSSQNFVSQHSKHIDLNGCRHVDIKGLHDFNVHDTSRHQPVARDWTISRKRFAATIACINTALIGIVIGIYAGEVPAIQYVIVDLGQHTILGNVVLYLGLAIPTLFLWPLPLMHGRKPYTIMALAVALCLQIPQGMAVSDFRSPYVSTYRHMLLFSRAVSGFALGFVNINQQASLLDVFGASLQSGNPHQEVVDPYDVRRHGGGMGLWLGLWSWCAVGSISIGFFIGTLIVDRADVAWGFWTSLVLMMMVLLLNVIGPEIRRSAFRRTVAEVMGEEGHISRVSRGEIKMHLKSAGPYWWGEEVKAGMELCWRMLQQPGFAILAAYTAWAYAHFTLVLMV